MTCDGRALLDDDAGIHEDDAVGDLAGEAHLVGDHDHRHAALGEVAHDLEHLADQLRVERARRLVEEHQLGVHGEGPGDGDALLLATGELRGVGGRLVAQAHLLEQLEGRRRRRPSS